MNQYESDMLDEKAHQLAELLDINITDIEVSYEEEHESEARFLTPEGVYAVMTQEEASTYDEFLQNGNEVLNTENFLAFRQSDSDERKCVIRHNEQLLDITIA